MLYLCTDIHDVFCINGKKIIIDMGSQKKKLLSKSKSRGLLIVAIAAVLIELLSGVQYYHTHLIIEEQLEKRAESELMMKAILIKSTLNSTEDILKNHLWDIFRNLSNPDSIDDAVQRIVLMNRNIRGGFMAFAPYFYPSKGRLFEPYAQRRGDDVVREQIAGPHHDYTERLFYKEAIATREALWVDPYVDNEGAQTSITSYVIALRNAADSLVGVVGIDISLEWLSDTIDVRHIYPSSFNLLLTEEGEIITQPSDARVSLRTSEHIMKLINDSTVKRENSHSGRSRIIRFKDNKREGTVFYDNMRGAPHWQIAVVCYDNEVYGDLNKLRLQLLALMAIAFAIMLFIIRYFALEEKKLNEKSLEQERMGSELRIASNIQKSLMTVNESEIANTENLSVWGTLEPAKLVGGDLYNAFIRDDKLFFCIGDVSGKGVPSALIMAVTHSLFRNIANHENNPAHIVEQMNETGCRNNKTNMFTTLFVGVLDLPSGILRYCNAGHEIPVLMSREWTGDDKVGHVNCRLLDVKPNLPIGLFNDFVFEQQEVKLRRGETLFLYTDGLTESRSQEGKQFGRKRMMQVLSECSTLEPRRLVEDMVKTVRGFTGTKEQLDDLTLLALCYTPVEENFVLDEELTLQNNVSEIKRLNNFVKDACSRLDIDSSLTYKLRLAVEEAVVNVMEYAYPSGTQGQVHIRMHSNGHRLKFIISDTGISFNPTEASVADTTLSAEERPIGGLGILLVRKLMDSINYERIDGKNVLTLRLDYRKAKDEQKE